MPVNAGVYGRNDRLFFGRKTFGTSLGSGDLQLSGPPDGSQPDLTCITVGFINSTQLAVKLIL